MGLGEWLFRLLGVILGFGSAVLFFEDFIEPVVLVVASEYIGVVEG